MEEQSPTFSDPTKVLVLKDFLTKVRQNKRWRTYDYTDPRVQLVEMYVPKDKMIPMEIHDVTQLIYISKGRVILTTRPSGRDYYTAETLDKDFLVVIPPDTHHEVLGIKDSYIFTVYAPMEHLPSEAKGSRAKGRGKGKAK